MKGSCKHVVVVDFDRRESAVDRAIFEEAHQTIFRDLDPGKLVGSVDFEEDDVGLHSSSLDGELGKRVQLSLIHPSSSNHDDIDFLDEERETGGEGHLSTRKTDGVALVDVWPLPSIEPANLDSGVDLGQDDLLDVGRMTVVRDGVISHLVDVWSCTIGIEWIQQSQKHQVGKMSQS